jgi:predicted double-glycine peptidase
VNVKGIRLQAQVFYMPPAMMPPSAYMPTAVNSKFCIACAASIDIQKSSQPGSFVYFTTTTPSTNLNAILVKRIVMVVAGKAEEISRDSNSPQALTANFDTAIMTLPHGINPEKLALEIETSSTTSVWLAAELKPANGTYRIYGGSGFTGYTSPPYHQQILRSTNDYSGGASSIASVLLKFGAPVQEIDAMNGMMVYGERDKIIARLGFSLLDMKLYLAAIGVAGNGYSATTIDDFRDALNEPNSASIVLAEILGLKQFVRLTGVDQQYVYIASPSFGNIAVPLSNATVFGTTSEGAMVLFIMTVPSNWMMPILR